MHTVMVFNSLNPALEGWLPHRADKETEAQGG